MKCILKCVRLLLFFFCFLDMRPKRKNEGVITYHIPFNIRLLAPERTESKCLWPEVKLSAPVKERKSDGHLKLNKRDEAMEAHASRPRRGALSYTSTRRLQIKMEAEIREAKELIRPLVETDKELETFLSRQHEAKTIGREVTRKRVHEIEWGARQNKLQHHMAVCNPLEVKLRQNLYQQFLNHGNTKGFVFLDMCDLNAYNPYVLRDKTPHQCKLRAAELKEKEFFNDKFKRRTRCDAGCHFKWIGQSQTEHEGYTTPSTVADALPLRSADKSNTKHVRSCLKVPFHIRESLALDGKCHHADCWFSR
ncbi:protein FAM228A isoform X1 [Syngnathus scovelli]|uniref:protein FAM228A isoform X1 n=2 Tax=Syngnathus scovelli TaxID=161590 RepID=UPI00210FB337|nr:protein FAM228A isoform X1 [Syngnathus scovelli]